MDLNSIKKLPPLESAADDKKDTRAVGDDWRRRFNEVNGVTREHERQMELLRSSPRFMSGDLGFDNEATRALARLREQTSFLERVQSPLSALTSQIPGKDFATRIAGLDARRLSDSIKVWESPYSGISDMLARGSAFDLAAKAALGFTDRFRVPSSVELSPLLSHMPDSVWAQYGLSKSRFELAAANTRSPWLDTLKQMESVTSLAKLQGISHLLTTRPSFDLEAAAALRIDLGDWRDRFAMPDMAALDIPVRTALYVERGYNPALADFPAETFETEVAELRGEIPILVAAYGEPVPPSEDTAFEDALHRNQNIYTWLFRFETQIRQFIDTRMTAEYGRDWPRQKLPNGLYDKWMDKKNKDKSGTDWPLVFYADFTDYELIITRADNWKTIFAPFFTRAEHVRESLQRLYLPRLATMHARPLTHDDELFVYAEVKRISQRFSIK